jgi:hypothetical protein
VLAGERKVSSLAARVWGRMAADAREQRPESEKGKKAVDRVGKADRVGAADLKCSLIASRALDGDGRRFRRL